MMRTIFTILLLLPLLLTSAAAQTPLLMNYQGVARDADGAVLQHQAIGLRISILLDSPNGQTVYSERHTVETNDFGMFTLRIGDGDLRQGALDALPWGEHSFWLQVEMDQNGGTDYALLGASELLSVPYAFHALRANEADRLTSKDPAGTQNSSSSNGSPWSTYGNENTNASQDFVGTADRVDLVFRTDNIERMRLTAYGKLGIGTADPASTFDVKGNASIGSGYAGAIEAPANGMIVEGNVGIGEPYPSATLEVGGELVVGEHFTGYNIPPLNGALFEGRVGIGTPGPGSMLSVKGGLSVGNSFSENAAPDNGGAFEGKLGIGTTIPKSWLGVAGNAAIGSEYARAFDAPTNGLIVQGDVGFGTESPLSRLGVAGNVSIGSTYASTYPAPEDGLMVEGPLWSGVYESDYAFHVLGDSYLDGTAEITGNTKIGGTLDVDGVTTIHDLTDVPVITGLRNASIANFLGSFRTKGGAGVEKNLNVGEDLGVRRDAYVGRDLDVGGTASFKNLVVENYADIGSNPDPVVDPDLNPTPLAPVTLINKGETVLEKKVAVTDATGSSAPNNGALVVAGGVGVGQNLNVDGKVVIDYSTDAATSTSDKAGHPLYLKGKNQGMAIELNVASNNNNQYIGFWDNGGKKGSIQAETQAERVLTFEYFLMTLQHVFDVTDAAVELISEVTDFRVGVGLGAVTVTPGVAKIAYATAKIILLAAQVALEQSEYIGDWGVAYNSGNADYAEWLERADHSETFAFGDVVGVRGGKISKRIGDGDMVMVISKSPIVLGNTPPDGQEQFYEMCAFLGQVPVKVVGPVAVGDYIIPSGQNNGVGIAVDPSDLTAEQASRVIGVAWSSVEAGRPGYANTAVGMPIQAGVDVLQRQSKTISSLQTRVDAMETVLRELIPDFDARLARLGLESGDEASVDAAAPAPGGGDDGKTTTPVPIAPVPGQGEPNPDLLTEEVFTQAIGIARDNLRGLGYTAEDVPLIQKLENEPSFRSAYLAALKGMIRKGGDRTELDRLMENVK
ncbi:MAG: hypothetical protein JXA28_15195 [Bacteroidetes bacterium]|nr:hypothetical protein [Bacteroidota bacterium]